MSNDGGERMDVIAWIGMEKVIEEGKLHKSVQLEMKEKSVSGKNEINLTYKKVED